MHNFLLVPTGNICSDVHGVSASWRGRGEGKKHLKYFLAVKDKSHKNIFFKGACHSKHQIGNVLFGINFNGAQGTKITIVL